MPDLRILALDCATATGWATNALGGVESGVQRFELRRGESAGTRWLYFRQWLTDLLERTRPEIVIFEQAFIGPMRSGTVAELAYGMTTRVQEIAESLQLEYRPVHNATLKSWATGKGNAGKDQMLVAAAQRFPGRAISDDNEADALLLLAWGLAGFPEREKKPKPARKTSPRRKAQPTEPAFALVP